MYVKHTTDYQGCDAFVKLSRHIGTSKAQI